MPVVKQLRLEVAISHWPWEGFPIVSCWCVAYELCRERIPMKVVIGKRSADTLVRQPSLSSGQAAINRLRHKVNSFHGSSPGACAPRGEGVDPASPDG